SGVRIACAALVACACAEGGDATLDARAAIDARPPADAAIDAAPGPDADPPPLYPTQALSPLTPAVARHLRAVAATDATLNAKVFAKVGAPGALACFSGTGVTLGTHADLQATIDFFNGGDAGGVTPFSRASAAAAYGEPVTWALAGNPSPIDAETMSTFPRYAVVQFGAADEAQLTIYAYAAGMLDVVDKLQAEGIVPIVGSTPATSGDTVIPRENLVARGIAQGRLVPFFDLY